MSLVGVLPYLTRREYPKNEVVSSAVLISGASTGIGRHAAVALATSGVHVYAGVRKQKDLDSLANEGISTLHGVMLDVTDESSVINCVGFVKQDMFEKNLTLAAVVNNAGISRQVPAEFHEVSDAEALFDTNVFGMMRLTKASIPLLRRDDGFAARDTGKGRIIMVSSVAGVVGSPLASVYSASKFAMEGYSDSLRQELSDFDISVSVVEPGYVKTAIFNSSAQSSLEVMTSTSTPTPPTDVSDVIDDKYSIQSLYPYVFDPVRKEKRTKMLDKADDPSVTTAAIIHSIFSPHPNTRYPVARVAGGLPAWFVVWMKWALSDRALDMIVGALQK